MEKGDKVKNRRSMEEEEEEEMSNYLQLQLLSDVIMGFFGTLNESFLRGKLSVTAKLLRIAKSVVHSDKYCMGFSRASGDWRLPNLGEREG